MALPNKIDASDPTGAASPATIDNQLRALKLAIEDIFGVVDNTNISAAAMEISATGLKNLRFQNAAADPGTAGYLQRNGAQLMFHNGTSAAALQTTHTPWRGHIYRYYLANTSGYVSDTTNDIYITTGECASDDAAMGSRVMLTNESNLIKQLDAVWAAGNNAGGRCTAEALANGTWHAYAFRRAGGAHDVCFSQTLTPTLPDSGTNKRRIGSFLRSGGTNRQFFSDGDYFWLNEGVLSVDSSNPGTTAVSATMTVPTGIALEALFNVTLDNTTTFSLVHFSPLFTNDVVVSFTAAPLGQICANAGASGAIGQMRIPTNTSGQIRYRLDASDANTRLRVLTYGWFDKRDRQGDQT